LKYIRGDDNGADGLSRFCSNNDIFRTVEADAITSEDRIKMLQSYHEVAGHGSNKTMQYLMKNKVCWKGMDKDIKNFVKTCDVCEKAGQLRKNTKNKVIKV
jgi:hypothetical protein